MYDDMPTDNPIDLAVLARLLSTDDEAYLHDMVKLFWNTMRETAAELNALRDIRDAAKLRDAAHAAKGASASVGAVSIASLLRELQFAATDADWNQIEDLMPKIETEFTKLGQYIETIQVP